MQPLHFHLSAHETGVERGQVARRVGDAPQAGDALAQGAVKVVQPVAHILALERADPFLVPGAQVEMVAAANTGHPGGGLFLESGRI